MGTIKGCINTKKTLKGHQLMVRIQYSRTKKKEIRLGVFLQKLSYFDTHSGLVRKRKDVDYKNLNKMITNKISELQNQNIDLIENHDLKTDLLIELDRNIRKSEAEGKFNSRRIYFYTRRHLCDFLDSNNRKQILLLADIDDVFLDDFKIYLINKGLAPSTMKIYFDKIKTVFNVINKRLKQNIYNPLSNYRIKITNRKLVLPADTIRKFEEYVPLYQERMLYQQWCLFQFYSQGTRISDIIKMKWSNIVITSKAPYEGVDFSKVANILLFDHNAEKNCKPIFHIKFNALKTDFEHKMLMTDKLVFILRYFLDRDLQIKYLTHSFKEDFSEFVYDKKLRKCIGIENPDETLIITDNKKSLLLSKLIAEQIKRTPNKCICHNVDINTMSNMELRTFIHNKTTTINKSLASNENDENYPIKEHLSTHSFRHLFAINYYTATRDIYSLSKLLFHNNIATTERYLKKLDIQLIADDDISKFYSDFK